MKNGEISRRGASPTPTARSLAAWPARGLGSKGAGGHQPELVVVLRAAHSRAQQSTALLPLSLSVFLHGSPRGRRKPCGRSPGTSRNRKGEPPGRQARNSKKLLKGDRWPGMPWPAAKKSTASKNSCSACLGSFLAAHGCELNCAQNARSGRSFAEGTVGRWRHRTCELRKKRICRLQKSRASLPIAKARLLGFLFSRSLAVRSSGAGGPPGPVLQRVGRH